ncbi:hypothetical protein BT96DRAFT_530538 [Gymnopus androsaceus JB14]|uniref:Uncharacterized protein n=1 Tax=Gymnopus androsaceus JB14 TaxID=1447944 RepID=A0A6A4IME9_9AGAR|nr:hypothetical protein BT96DRAFT_530538 [Gymnopus androsaceus JB14]
MPTLTHTSSLIAGKYTDLPVPIPESAISTTSPSTISRTTLPPAPLSLLIPSSFPSPTLAPTTLYLAPSTHASSASAPHSESTVSIMSFSSVLPSSTAAASQSSGSPTTTHKQISVTIITVLAVGSAFFLLGIFIIIKACTRPTRRTRPKPSLPILDDAFADDFYGSPKMDSPIFGGKERLSSQNEPTVPTWTYYSEPKSEPEPVSPVPAYDVADTPHALHPIVPGEIVGPNDFLFPRPPPSQSVPTTLLSSSSHFGVPNVLTTAASRFSIARSVSVYPASPALPARDSKNYTADGHPIMKRSSKLAIRRSRTDMTEVTSRMSRDSLAYDGAEMKSPQFLAREAPSAPVGRTRIKSSYYTPGSYPRMSSLPSSTSTKTLKTAKTDDIIEFDMHQLPPIQRTESRKNRDTRALTSALGLASPRMETIPLSPTQTIYPDDSLSVVDVKRSKSKLPVAISASTGTVDTSTALGSLMLMDFGTTDRSLSTLTTRLGEPIEYGSSNGKAQDRPPRVPSPPPLPSLAQMGLEHADPEGYADYRSPTYSIFGLYGEDRKSRLSIQRG